MKATVVCWGGPLDGRTFEVENLCDFMDLSAWPHYGVHRYILALSPNENHEGDIVLRYLGVVTNSYKQAE